MTGTLLFATAGGEALSSRLRSMGHQPGEIFRDLFPDGEIYHLLKQPVVNHRSVVAGSCENPASFLELLDVSSLVADEGTLGLTIAMTGKGNAFRSRVVRRALATVAQTPLGNELLVHSGRSAPRPASLVASGSTARRRPPVGLRSQSKPLALSTPRYAYMARSIASHRGWEECSVVWSDWDNPALGGDVWGRDVVLVAGTIDDAETAALVFLASRLVEEGALSLTMVVPYFGYSTMERAVKPGEAVKAKIRARLLSSVPRCPMGNRIVLVDLHTEGLPHYFGDGIRTTHLYAVKRVILDRLLDGRQDGRLCSTDAGRSKWTESLVKDIGGGWQPCFAFKKRIDGSTTRSLGVLGDVAGQSIDLFDDMIRRGSSAIEAASGYRQAGCTDIRFIASHAVMPGNTLERLKNAVDGNGKPLFKQIVVTDSHPRARELAGDSYRLGTDPSGEFFRVEPIGHLLAGVL